MRKTVGRLGLGVLATLPVLLAGAAFAESPTIQIPRIDTAPVLSAFAEMQASPRVADSMLKVTGFIAREPADGVEPTQSTDVYLAYDQHNLYAAFVLLGLRARPNPCAHDAARRYLFR
jgi:hypothetical protein